MQAHYAICHAKEECPKEFKQCGEQQIHCEEREDELQKVKAEVEAPQIADLDVAQCSHCKVF